MRIAVNALAATRGGAVTMLRPFLAALRDLEPDWHFTVYVANPDLDLSMDGVTPVVVRTEGWRRLWLELFALDRRARRDGADLTLNMLNSGSLVPQLPTITWQRNALYFDRRWLGDQPRRTRFQAALRRNLALLTCRASAGTVAPSQTMANFVRDWHLGRHLRVEAIPDGVDVARFTNTDDRRSDRPFTIGVMGHAAAHRGLDRAVRVLDEVRSNGVDAALRLTVPRHGNPAFQGTIDDAARLAEHLALTEHVNFGGMAKDPVAWYSHLDLLLIPSECESFCFPVVEGFAAGLPVVTSGLPVLREVAGDVALHGRTCSELAAKVLALYHEDDDQRRDRQERARTRAMEFSWAETARRTRALIVKTVASARV